MQIFEHGFSVKEMDFGWNKQGIFRLPKTINLRFYPLKKLSKILIDKERNVYGYRCNRGKFSEKQLRSMNKKIDTIRIETITKTDCPF